MRCVGVLCSCLALTSLLAEVKNGWRVCSNGRSWLYYWYGRDYGGYVKPIEVSMPPALFTNADGIRYAIAGSAWVEVPPETTFDDLPKYMVFKRPEIKRPAGEKVWRVEGSKGNIYTVKLSEGTYTCTCPGFSFRRKCRHIEGVK